MKGNQTMSQSFYTAEVLVLADRNATVASVELLNEDVFSPVLGSNTGSAKRENGDRNDPNIARDLAVGRALENLGRQLRRRGEAAVRKAVANGQSA